MDLLFLLTIVPAYLVGSFFIRNDPGPEEPQSAIRTALIFGLSSIVLALIFSFAFNLLITSWTVAIVTLDQCAKRVTDGCQRCDLRLNATDVLDKLLAFGF